MRRTVPLLAALGVSLCLTGTALASVLTVGSYHGIKGQYTTIQAAVRAAKPGDWILLGPGDYKTRASQVATPRGAGNFPAAVLITTPNLHIRGMNRKSVIVDGTKPGSPRCSNKASAQNFGASDPASGGSVGSYARTAKAPTGLNGLMVWKARNVSIENLTACNFLGGASDAGNEIWWNGGADSGKVGGHGFYGGYLTATSTYLKGKSKAGEFSGAQYGVFSSNWDGGVWNQIYASNFNDSGFYIGACQQVCNQIVDHAWAEYDALGYSGSNSGGKLVVENSQFDKNEDGFDTNSQNGDEPSPQNGDCPGNGISPITHTHSCWVFIHNYVHDNNDPNVPTAGSAAAGPVGTGLTISGGRNDTVMDNLFAHNDAWGLALISYPDSGKPCIGGTLNFPLFGQGSCYFEGWNRAVIDNKFEDNGGYGKPSNGDFARGVLEGGHPVDCFRGNTEVGGGPLTSDAAAIQQAMPNCNGALTPGVQVDPPSFLDQILCDTRVGGASSCVNGPYPVQTKIVMHPLPRSLKTMPNVCRGVPRNPWCEPPRPSGGKG
jgi:hypothetical protein